MNFLGGALCPVAGVLSGLYSLLEPEVPAYVLPTKVCSAFLGSRWTETTVEEPLDIQYAYTDETMSPIKTGMLSLHEAEGGPALLNIPLDDEDDGPRPLRLSTLNQVLATHEIAPTSNAPVLTMTTPDGTTTSVSLPITFTQILAFPSKPVVENHPPWTSPIHLRVAVMPQVAEPTFLAPYVQALEHRLSQSPHVTLLSSTRQREAMQRPLADLQNPAYATPNTPRPGRHAAPAFLLTLDTLHIPPHRQIIATLFHLATARIVLKDIQDAPTTPRHFAHLLATVLHATLHGARP